MKHYIYIIFSNILDKFYIGVTKNLEDRLQKHNSHHKGYTGKANDWKLMHFEEYYTKIEALKREKELKSWKSRKRLKELISKSDK